MNKEMCKMWEIRQRSSDSIELYIYGDVDSDSADWADEVTRSETSAKALRERLSTAGDIKNIDIYINSYGGSVFEGTAIYNQLRRHPAKKTVHIDGFACSIASVIAMAGDEVLMPRNALMMIHNAWMIAVGNAAELRKAADDLDKVNSAGRQAYLQKSGGKLGEPTLIEMMDAETWLTAEDCIRYGLADGYEKADAEIDEAKTDTQLAGIAARLRQRIDVQRSLNSQLRELVEQREPLKAEVSSEPAETEEAEAEQKKDEPKNTLLQMLAGTYRKDECK